MNGAWVNLPLVNYTYPPHQASAHTLHCHSWRQQCITEKPNHTCHSSVDWFQSQLTLICANSAAVLTFWLWYDGAFMYPGRSIVRLLALDSGGSETLQEQQILTNLQFKPNNFKCMILHAAWLFPPLGTVFTILHIYRKTCRGRSLARQHFCIDWDAQKECAWLHVYADTHAPGYLCTCCFLDLATLWQVATYCFVF